MRGWRRGAGRARGAARPGAGDVRWRRGAGRGYFVTMTEMPNTTSAATATAPKTASAP